MITAKPGTLHHKFQTCVLENVTAIGNGRSVPVILSGPLRLTSSNPQAAETLAITALAGSSTKEKKIGYFACVAAGTAPADTVITLTAGIKAVGLMIRCSGTNTGWGRAPVVVQIAGTGMTTMKVAIESSEDAPVAEAFVLLVTDNGGPGQISAPSGITVTIPTLDNAGVAALGTVPAGATTAFAVAVEPVTTRDFPQGRTSS